MKSYGIIRLFRLTHHTALDKQRKAVEGETQTIKFPAYLMLGSRILCVLAAFIAAYCVQAPDLSIGQAGAAQLSLSGLAGLREADSRDSRVLDAGYRQRRIARFRALPRLPVKAERPLHNVTLRAALSAGSPPLVEGLSWRVFRLGGGREERELVWSGGGAEPQIRLKPGRYFAEAAFGLASNGEGFEVAAGKPVSLTLSLDAGTIIVHASAMPGGAPLDDVFFILRRTGEGADTREEIGRSSIPQAVFHVPAGSYKIIAKHGLASVETPVQLAAGAERRIEVPMQTGSLKLTGRAKTDSPPMSGVTYFVFQPGEAGAPSREIARSKLDEPLFVLTAGHYRIAAVLGLARVEQEIDIKAGETRSQDLVLDAGGVRLGSSLAGNGKPIEDHLIYRVFGASAQNGAPNQELATATTATPTLFLPSGRYRIESQYGWHNARQVREVEVKAGEVQDVAFEHKASDVKLRLVDRPGGQSMERVKWTLKYNGGGTVLISQDAAPSLILQAGSYQAMAQHESKTYTQTFEAASNQEQIVEIVAQ